MSKVFLSHKQLFVTQAKELNEALKIGVPGATIFQSDDIEKGAGWRKEIDRELDEAKCFVLLYGSPEQDWSWCFYEAGRFSRKGRNSRPIYCVHPKKVKVPSPVANLQGITSEPSDIQKWIGSKFFRDIRSRAPTKREVDQSVKAIEKIVNSMPTTEKFLKPNMCIVPTRLDDWKAGSDGRKIDFSNARIEIDEISARDLGFADQPNLELLPFLRRIACDTTNEAGKVEFWITKFFDSLQGAVDGKANFQEEAYFRHESGKIMRPVVVSFTRPAFSKFESYQAALSSL